MIGKVYEDWKKVNITTVFIKSEKEDLGIYTCEGDGANPL